MSSNKSAAQEIYQPPARRSGGSSAGNTPSKMNQQVPRRELPPNCCEEDDGIIEDSPIKSGATSENSFSSNSQNGRANAPSSSSRDLSSDLPQTVHNKRNERLSNSRKIPKATRLVGSAKSIKDSPNRDDNTGNPSPGNTSQRRDPFLEELHLADTPYIDSHCHTDFIYTQLSRSARSFKEDEGIGTWVDRYPEAFPKAFMGFIANFIKPDLFVDCGDNNQYDFEWIINDIRSNLYIGTTWGCHPHYAEKWGQMKIFWSTLEHILSERPRYKVLAIGECGIDLHRCESDMNVQKTVFDTHVTLAFKYELPLVIHCRNGKQGNAEDICLEILQQNMKRNHRNLKIHRHCYTENWPIARRWLQQCPDVHFGYTPGILSFNESQIEAVRRIPLDRILLETDAPYFKPRCFDGVAPPKVCLPGMAIATASRIAEIKKLTLDEVLRATFNNTRRVYEIPVY